MTAELIIFNGTNFRRYPNAKTESARRYFNPGIGDRQRGIEALHREIWKAANGPIPDGYEIHHADHDYLNNDLSNLVCLSRAEHRDHHGHAEDTLTRLAQPEWLEHLAQIRPLAKVWHSSPEGFAWHQEHGRKTMAERPVLAGVCDQCGNAFLSKLPQRFCSNKCKSAWRRDSGLDNETRTCQRCGAEFTVNRYARKNYCSRSCASKAARSKP